MAEMSYSFKAHFTVPQALLSRVIALFSLPAVLHGFVVGMMWELSARQAASGACLRTLSGVMRPIRHNGARSPQPPHAHKRLDGHNCYNHKTLHMDYAAISHEIESG